MEVRAGREAGRADEADHLPLANLCPGPDARGEARLVVIGRDVAVGVLDLGAPAVARIPFGLDHRAVAGRHDRRADPVRPVDAGVHLRVAEDRMAPVAEARAELALRDGLAHQEFLQRAPALVKVLDGAVVGRLIAVDAAGLAPERQAGVEDFGPIAAVFLVESVENLEAVAARHPLLEVHIIAEDPYELLDGLARQVVLEGGLVEAFVEAHAALVAVLLALLGRAAPRGRALRVLVDRRGHGNIRAAIVDGGDALDAVLAEQDDAHDLAPVGGPGARPEENANALAFRERRGPRPPSKRRHDRGDLVVARALRLERGLEGLAALQREVALLERRLAGAGLDLRQRGEVLRDDPHLDRVEGRFDGAGVAERLRRRVGLAQGAREQELRRQRQPRPAARFRGRAALFLDLGGDVVVGEDGRARLDGRGGEVALDDRDLGVGDLRGRLGEALAVVVAVGEQPQRIEARDVRRIGAGRERQVRRDPDERPDLDDLAVAGAHRHRGAEALLRDRDDLRLDELVSLAGDARALVLAGPAARGRDRNGLGHLGEARLALDRDVDGAADERRAGDAGQHARPKPAPVDDAAVDLALAAGSVERGLVAKLNAVAAIGGPPTPLRPLATLDVFCHHCGRWGELRIDAASRVTTMPVGGRRINAPRRFGSRATPRPRRLRPPLCPQ